MAEPQKIFAVQYHYVPGLSDQRDVHRAAHREFLVSLGPAMVAAGAYVDDPAAALLLVKAEDSGSVRDLLDGDPFRHHGLIATIEVHEWSCAVGDRAAAIRGDGA
ncbi:YciI family protein [Citricoccus nitrophenolicus]|uniref:YciI family protein n=1 Tax=Citricoccus nitrophenolicus TaxID=863575 RepID=A0ABV0IF15_9MICC|nr:YciI family protein [Citricoccus sp. I39-566]WMY76862.1 YciI family protein [Citricoccus sp. I39-566]